MTDARILRIGRMPYLNVAPFYFDLEALRPYEIIMGSPLELGEMARRDEIDMGPLSLLDTLSLPEMEPIDDLAVACEGPVGSVLLFSDRPFADLGAARITATTESVTSIRLLEVLLRRAGINGFHLQRSGEAADALLLIGDSALAEVRRGVWSFVTDLCEEWTRLEHLPFVFARWVVRIGTPRIDLIARTLQESLDKGLSDLPAVLKAFPSPVSSDEARAYLNGFLYRPGSRGDQAIARFQTLLGEYGNQRAPR